MAIVRKYGKPILFIAFTCNPSWLEITCELLEGQTATDKPDLVLQLKLSEFVKDLKKDEVFG